MPSDNPTEKLSEAVKCIAEAARLHQMLKSNSTKEAVSTALMWRFDIGHWQAEQCYQSALTLLDCLTKRP